MTENLDFTEHNNLAKAKRGLMVGFDGANYQAVTLNGDGTLKLSFDKTFKSAKIDVNTVGLNEIVPAVPGKSIYVFAILVINSSGSAITIDWFDGNTALSGPTKHSTKGGYTINSTPPSFLFKTSIGQPLNLNLSASRNVGGFVSYWEE